MALINISNLTFSYESNYENIFENVSFQIDTDWKLGFTGRNGRGKTTFLNLLLGKYVYSGTITVPTNFEYFPYTIADKSLQTIKIVESIHPDVYEWELKKEISLLKIDEDVLYRPFDTLSGGEQTKVLLATMFLKENSFMLIDEPTNHLDAFGRQIVSDYLNKKKSFLLVSHDRNFLDNCVSHILSINKKNIEIQRGNFSSWLVNKELQDNFELAENERLKKDIKRLKESARVKAEWSDRVEATKIGLGLGDRGNIGHKAAKMMKRSKSIEARQNKAIDEKSQLLKNIDRADQLKITQLDYHSNRLVIMENVSIFYCQSEMTGHYSSLRGDATKIIACQNVSFSTEKGDRIALIGKNGTGKSSILKLICDVTPTFQSENKEFQYTGIFNKGIHLKISYVPQDTANLRGSLITFIHENQLDESLFKAILRKLDFSRTQFEKDLSEYSGGQKKKILIAKSLTEKAHLLIWDEPLNFVDIISRIQIESLILNYAPTIIFVEHDMSFCENIATKKVFL
ncbi:MAG: ABC-F type ribosomal protection protein [Candidatus Cloacimonetes bacterium]|nr:ABC-F type ribosomal protection protein [Candidatus Cloacimonadota bacterium]